MRGVGELVYVELLWPEDDVLAAHGVVGVEPLRGEVSSRDTW
jgi:hypothetical protein